jgi:O-antigen ligase
MGKIIKLNLYCIILSVIFGNLASLTTTITGLNINLIDILIGILDILLLTNYRKIQKDLIINEKTKFFLLFIVIAAFSLILSPLNLQLTERLVASLYLVRIAGYFGIYIAARFLIEDKNREKEKIISLLRKIFISTAFIGWFQYYLYPDLTYLSYLGWDPHFKRIFSVFFDPNFLGIILIFGLILTISINKINRFKKALTLFFILGTILFTYSRSSFLALTGTVFFLFFHNRKLKYLPFMFMIFILTLFLLPRPGGVGVQLERIFSIESRLNNWQEGAKIIKKYPILGVGFNTLRYEKMNLNPENEKIAVSHSGAGFENSYIFIAVTTGILGFAVYSVFLINLLISNELIIQMTVIALVIHAMFLNTVFYPWIMLLFWLYLALFDKPVQGACKKSSSF